MSKKEIKPLSEAFLKSFDSKASRVENRVVSETTDVQILEAKLSDVTRQINAARIGGVGNIGKLSEQKSQLQFALQEAKKLSAKAMKDALADDKAKAQPKDKVSVKKAPWDMKKEDVDLDEAVNEKAIKKAVDDGKSMDVIVGMFANKRTTNTDEIRKVVKDYMWKKRMKKEDVEVTELHPALLEAHGIEKKVAERVKKVFDAMSSEDKAAFMKSYLKNPKAATEYMFKDMKKMAKEEVELDEALDSVDPKAVKKKFDDRKDKDIDNDGDVDSSDEYLHKRRKAISKSLAKEEVELEEDVRKMSNSRLKYHMNNKNIPHGSYSWDEMKAERDRRLKTGGAEAYKKAKMSMSEEVELEEGYTINHKTFSSAVQHAKAQVEKQGYTIDDDEWDRKVAMGPKKPGTGKTNRYTIDLMKGGKETRRKLQMQVYYDEGRYELNMYVS